MTQRSDKCDATNDVPQQRGQEKTQKVFAPRGGMSNDHIEHRSRTCHDVIESTKSNHGSENNDDTDACGLCSRKQPYDQCDYPSSKNSADENDPKSRSGVSSSDFIQRPGHCRIKQSNFCDACGKQASSQEVGRQNNGPQLEHPRESPPISVMHEGQNDGECVL